MGSELPTYLHVVRQIQPLKSAALDLFQESLTDSVFHVPTERLTSVSISSLQVPPHKSWTLGRRPDFGRRQLVTSLLPFGTPPSLF